MRSSCERSRRGFGRLSLGVVAAVPLRSPSLSLDLTGVHCRLMGVSIAFLYCPALIIIHPKG